MGRSFWQRLTQTAIVILFSALALRFFGTMDTRLGPLDLRLQMRWSVRGETRLVLPPLGQIKADTHGVPVAFCVQLNRIDENLLQSELADQEKPAEYLQTFLPQLRRIFIHFFLVLLLVGAGAGVMAGMIIWGCANWKRWVRSLLLGAVFTGVVLGGVMIQYNQQAFDRPRYEGMLEAAPWLLDLVDKGLAQLDTLGRKLEVMAGNLNRLFTQVDQLDPLARADGTLKVVHVSDIHNNPAAYDFLRRVVKGFGADLIIDTGDITDYGTPLEARMAEALAGVGVPYFFVPGNHDAPEAIARLKQIRGIRVLDNGVVTYKGLNILAWRDPTAKTGKLTATAQELRQAAEELTAEFARLEKAPDLVAVHNVTVARGLLGKVPLVLHGHDHRARIYERSGTRVVDAGTTGAAGVRALENVSQDGVPFSLALLHFDPVEDGEGGRAITLTAVDLIKVYSLNGRFVLERKVVKGGEENTAVSRDLVDGGSAAESDRVHP